MGKATAVSSTRHRCEFNWAEDNSLRCFKSLRHSCLSTLSGFLEFNDVDDDEVSMAPNWSSDDGEMAEEAEAEGALTESTTEAE